MFEQLPTKGQVDSLLLDLNKKANVDIIMLRAIGKFPFANQAVEMMWDFLGITQSLKSHDQ